MTTLEEGQERAKVRDAIICWRSGENLLETGLERADVVCRLGVLVPDRVTFIKNYSLEKLAPCGLVCSRQALRRDLFIGSEHDDFAVSLLESGIFPHKLDATCTLSCLRELCHYGGGVYGPVTREHVLKIFHLLLADGCWNNNARRSRLVLG